MQHISKPGHGNIDGPLLVPDTTAAALVNVSRATLHRLRAAGKWGPEPVRLGRRLLFRLQEMCEWVDAACPIAEVWAAMRAQNKRIGKSGR
jgi:hypothetical protein